LNNSVLTCQEFGEDLRIICHGQSGSGKKEILNDLLVKLKDFGSGFDKFQLYPIGHLICDEVGVTEDRVLNLPLEMLSCARKVVFQTILTKIEESSHLIVDTHAVFRWNNALFPAFDFSQLDELTPSFICTIIDDVDRVKYRLSQSKPDEQYTLKDILVWREEEIIVSEVIAGSLKIPHYILPQKSASEVLFNLVTKPSQQKIYASYPISHIKADPVLWPLVCEHRTRLKNHFTVFDPIDIEERRLKVFHDVAIDKGETTVNINVLGEEIEFDIDEIKNVLSDIDGQILHRDFKLIDQSDAIIAYIPLNEDKPIISSGVERELEHAYNTGKDVFIICENDNLLSPFVTQKAHFIAKDIDAAITHFQENGWIES